LKSKSRRARQALSYLEEREFVREQIADNCKGDTEKKTERERERERERGREGETGWGRREKLKLK